MIKGWFVIDGVQAGDRTFEQQWTGLEDVAARNPRTVLDLGCAEGLIARELVMRGATWADGIEMHPGQYAEAVRQCHRLPMAVHCVDLREPNVLAKLPLMDAYDVVLLLSILHKMRDPLALLRAAVSKAGGAVVVRLPATTYENRGVKVKRTRYNILEQMSGLGWRLVSEPATCLEEWLGIFERATGAKGG